MKIILKTFLLTVSLIFIFLIYLTFVGIETSKFNSQISNKIKKIDKDLDLNLKSIKIILNPFKFKIYAKTIGPKLKAKDKIIEIENIQTQISLLSIINNEFSLEDLEASTKTIEIKNLVSFLRQFYNTPTLYIRKIH